MRFAQVDVFSETPYRGNPVAVLLDAAPLSEERMQDIARWTNLSETTFVLPPTHPDADYRVRIFTPSGELPFAGHPTLGTAHAWLEYGGVPRGADVIQECAAGLITVRTGERLAFAAPPTVRTGPLEPEVLGAVEAAIGVDVLDHQWVDNGPGWAAVQLPDAETVRGVTPDWAALGDLRVGLVALRPGGLEVRALFGGIEDPVTGSLNASLAQWFYRTGKLASDYTAFQGAGRVHVSRDAQGAVWIGGATVTCFSGTAS